MKIHKGELSNLKYAIFSCLFFLINTVYAQFDFTNCKTCSESIKAKTYKTSLWLGQVNLFPFSNNRFTFDLGISLFGKNNYLPSFSNSLRVTKNLTFISKIYSFNHGKQSPHIYGIGILYGSKSDNGSGWISSLQKVNLRGLSDYRLSTITMGVSKILSFNIMNISYGVGSIFYDQKFYKLYENVSKKIENQVNFIHISGLTEVKNLQFETKFSFNFNIIILSCSIKKGIL